MFTQFEVLYLHNAGQMVTHVVNENATIKVFKLNESSCILRDVGRTSYCGHKA